MDNGIKLHILGLPLIKVIKMKLIHILIVVGCIFTVSCKKWITVDPPVTLSSGDNMFKTDGGAISAVTGLYVSMISYSGNDDFGSGQLTVFCGLSADELNLDNSIVAPDLRFFLFANALDPLNPKAGTYFWKDFYNYIYKCNSAILQLSDTSYLTPAVRGQLLGEVYFVRALSYFYLVNLYGNVPLILDIDYEKNRLASRTDTEKVWEQIKDDLIKAHGLLSDSYLDNTLLHTTAERVRPTKAAAAALLSRVFLSTKDWANAEIESSKVIENPIYSLDTLNGVFLKNSKEAIWQLQPVDVGVNTQEAVTFIPPSPDGTGYAHLLTVSNTLLNNFEAGDQRRIKWIDSISLLGTTYYYPYKYKVVTYGAPVNEYQMILRLGEQLLNRAEARAQQNDIENAIKDLDMVRSRAGLPLLQNTDPGISKEQLLDSIMHERQVELFAELGHRWLDLKRTGKVDAVMSVVTPLKSNGNAWQTHQQWYPVPVDELQKDPNLKQTDGY
jgi:hypothetical protein